MTKRKLSFEEAKRRYVHRFTMEHVPSWACERPCDSGGTATWYYAPQYRTDKEWYDNTAFPGEPEHILGARHNGCCDSRNPSWPIGQQLAQPYRVQ